MYRASILSYDFGVEAVEVIKETDKQVRKKQEHFGRISEVRENKVSADHKYHSSFAEARAWLVEMQRNRVEQCKQRLDAGRVYAPALD